MKYQVRGDEIAGVVEGARNETMAAPEYGEKLSRSRLTNYSTRDPPRERVPSPSNDNVWVEAALSRSVEFSSIPI